MRAVPVVAAIALLYAPVAMGHGPCGICLSRVAGPAGTEVTVRHTTAYWIRWNWRGLPQDGSLGPRYRRGLPTIDLVRLPRPRRDVAFRVPDVPPGPYPIVIFDGSESGFHYTWDLFRVTRAEPSRAEPSPWQAVAGAALAGAALFAVAYGARRSLRRV